MARPTVMTPAVLDAIVKALRAGNTRTAAAEFAGISYDTLDRAVDKNGGKNPVAEAVRQAEAQAEVGHVANLARAGQDGDWRASLSWLERRRWQDWGKKETVNLGGDKENPVQVDHRITADALALEGLRALVQAVEAQTPAAQAPSTPGESE